MFMCDAVVKTVRSKLNTKGLAMVQVVSRRTLTVEARVRARVNPFLLRIQESYMSLFHGYAVTKNRL
jgi:hypothetical protein